MAKKYTVMIFDPEIHGKNRTIFLSTRPFWVAGFVLLFFVLTTGIASFLAYSFYQDSRLQQAAVGGDINGNAVFKAQFANYLQQLDELNSKLAELDELEFKVRELVSYQDGSRVVKQVAVGGKEVDILREYYAFSDRREQEFFDSLNETLDVMRVEMNKREVSLAKLVDFLEEKRLVMLSTPTIWPTRGWVSSKFGFRESPFTGRRVFHEGLDIAAKSGLPVRATAKGIVVFAGEKAGYGKIVTIDHGYGYMTRYGHNSSLTVKVGDKVEKGDVIAKVGSTGRSTGPHVHYEVLVNGIPVNPQKFIIDENETALR